MVPELTINNKVRAMVQTFVLFCPNNKVLGYFRPQLDVCTLVLWKQNTSVQILDTFKKLRKVKVYVRLTYEKLLAINLSEVISMGSKLCGPHISNKTTWFLTGKRKQIRIKQNEYIPYYKHSKQNPIKGWNELIHQPRG